MSSDYIITIEGPNIHLGAAFILSERADYILDVLDFDASVTEAAGIYVMDVSFNSMWQAELTEFLTYVEQAWPDSRIDIRHEWAGGDDGAGKERTVWFNGQIIEEYTMELVPTDPELDDDRKLLRRLVAEIGKPGSSASDQLAAITKILTSDSRRVDWLAA